MNGYIDSKYVGHNLEEEIKELEEMTQVFAIVNEFDEEQNKLISKVNFLPLKLAFKDILFLSYIIYLIVGWIVMSNIFENVEYFGPFTKEFREVKVFQFYSIFIGLFIYFSIHLFIRYRISRRLNQMEIDFERKILKVKNIDFIGRFMFKEREFDFSELKQFRIRTVFVIWSIFGRKSFHIVSLETKDGMTHPMYLLRLKKWHRVNYKRLVHLYNSILKL